MCIVCDGGTCLRTRSERFLIGFTRCQVGEKSHYLALSKQQQTGRPADAAQRLMDTANDRASRRLQQQQKYYMQEQRDCRFVGHAALFFHPRYFFTRRPAHLALSRGALAVEHFDFCGKKSSLQPQISSKH